MPEWVRVKDKDTGHVRTVRREELPHGNYQELKQDAVDHVGDPLPPEYAEQPAASSTGSKEKA